MGYFIFDRKDNVGMLTVNCPERMNALSSELLTEMGSFIEMIESDTELRVLIITGAGRAFVAGADIAEMNAMDENEALEFARLGNSVFSRIENLAIPTIAAVNGFALGGGLELALSCDIIFAAENAKLGQPEVGLGIIPGFGGTQRLPRRIGANAAMKMILSGEIVSAGEGLAIRLVDKLCAADALIDEASTFAQKIARNAPIAVRYAKEAIKRFTCRDIAEDIAFENNRFAACFETADRTTGMTAFLEKNKNVEFEGR